MAGRFDVARRALWHARRGGVTQLREFLRRNRASSESLPSGRTGAGWQVPPARPRRSLTVGVIADAFTELALRFEWNQVLLTPGNWRPLLDSCDMVFIESAWHGNCDAWRYQLTGPKAGGGELRKLVQEARSRGIPTVFWNKEDPVHFDDFLATARLVDHVFTSDAGCVPDYRRALGHNRVAVFPFAAQPMIHNPMGRREARAAAEGDVAFAGSYFAHKYPERREQMEALLGGAIDAAAKGIKLDIFARFQGVDPNYEYPPEYRDNVRGELSYEEILTAYRGYDAFINVNSVPDSETMCARRVFEILACGTPVVSAPSPAISQMLGGSVLQCSNRHEAMQWFRALHASPGLRERLVYEGNALIWEHHTYSHRVDAVMRACGLDEHVIGAPRIAALVSTNRPQQLPHVINQLARQRGVELEPIILTHGFSASQEAREYANSVGLDVTWLEGDSGWRLGDCYNAMLDVARAPYFAKIDDDDIYGPYYLVEQVTALEFTGAEIVGKRSHFVKLDDGERTLLALRTPGQENCFTDFVSGPTITGRVDHARTIRFESRSRGEDTAFLRATLAAGGRIWASGTHGFIQVRAGHGHTWRVHAADILATARVEASSFTGTDDMEESSR